jgi:Fe-S-cluster-containing hydrogenase component 2
MQTREVEKKLRKRGFFLREDLKHLPSMPDEERMQKGPVAIIECGEEIPCNPCQPACPKGAIDIGEDIIAPPRLDPELCDGCGLCIASCPGLAVFVVDLNHSETKALIKLPYEFLPAPRKGQKVIAVDRQGGELGPVDVVQVAKSPKFNMTMIVSVAVPREWAMEVRNIRVMK